MGANNSLLQNFCCYDLMTYQKFHYLKLQHTSLGPLSWIRTRDSENQEREFKTECRLKINGAKVTNFVNYSRCRLTKCIARNWLRK